MTDFIVALHKISLVVLFIQLVQFCLGASNSIHLRTSLLVYTYEKSLRTTTR